jgi:hypothetical protein
MHQRVHIWFVLIAVHLIVAILGWVVGSDRLAAVVVGSIYLPLWPLGKLGLPVLRPSGGFIAPPSYLGWVAVVVFWLVAYWFVAALIARLLARRNRAA